MVDQPLREADELSDGPIMKKTGTKIEPVAKKLNL
jgi:hypothetical protein